MNYWLMKSEPAVFSIDDLKLKKTAGWDGVRNYQARNFMRGMKTGEKAFFYHSNANPSGIAGIMEISGSAYPDPTQFERGNIHYDAKATKKSPIWFQVDVRWLMTFERAVALLELRQEPKLKDMTLFKRSRLSVQPVLAAEWETIIEMAGGILKGR
ncbi:MAG: EVE domain-containing protein [Elusimicrobiota bacterium]